MCYLYLEHGKYLLQYCSVLLVLGALVIFTALLSVAFLHRGIKRHEWSGIAVVTIGLIVVGVGDFVFGVDPGSHNTTNGIVAGKFYFKIDVGLVMFHQL